jgi:hypothetical protein
MAVFKTHLSRTRAERVLFAYNEAVELGEKLSGLSKVVDEEVRQTIFLHTVNGYYQAYMAMGAPFRICFTEATRGDLMRRIHSVGAGRDSEQEVCPLNLALFVASSFIYRAGLTAGGARDV